MVNLKWHKTKYPGVRYREDPTRKYKKRPDRYIVIRYKRNGKLIGEAVGWETEGATLQEANQLRSQIRQNIRLGEGFQSLSEKREIEDKRKKAEVVKKEIKKKLNTPFDALALKYLDWAKDNKKTWWVDKGAYFKHIKKELGHLPIKDISPFHLERLKRNLRKKELSERSIQCYLNVVKAMFNRGIGWGIIEGKNPVTEISKTNKNFLKISDNRRLRFLCREDADMLFEELEARSPQLHDISLLSLHTGMRAGEIFNITWHDVDLTHEIITIKNPKNEETRQAYMTPQVKKILKARQNSKSENSDLLFTNRKGEKIREVSTTFDRAMKTLGFNNGVKDRQNKLVFHSLRHTFASWLALQGETLLTIRELMGHKDIKMTMRYAHLIPDHKKRAVLKLANNHLKGIVSPKIKSKSD